MNKQKVIHVITNFAGVGGAEMMLSRLIQQTQHECEHVIISLMKTSDVYADVLAICSSHYALHWNGLNSFSVLRKLRELLESLAPEIVQCWMYHANALTSLATLKMKNKPQVFWGIHHSLASPKDESVSTKVALVLSKFLAKKTEGIIYCAHSSLKQHQKYGFQNSNSAVIANGVVLEKYQPNPQLHEPIVIGFAGRYHTAKGYPYLFETISKLKDQPIVFKIAGAGVNLENSEIKQYFEQYNLSQNQVQLLDQISDMPVFYQSIDAFLMTSITEGFPNVLVEAMASGLPCISTDVGDAKYIVNDHGWIVPPRNADALAQALLAYVHLSVEEKKKLKQVTRLRVEQNFGIESVSQQYLTMWGQDR